MERINVMGWEMEGWAVPPFFKGKTFCVFTVDFSNLFQRSMKRNLSDLMVGDGKTKSFEEKKEGFF